MNVSVNVSSRRNVGKLTLFSSEWSLPPIPETFYTIYTLFPRGKIIYQFLWETQNKKGRNEQRTMGGQTSETKIMMFKLCKLPFFFLLLARRCGVSTLLDIIFFAVLSNWSTTGCKFLARHRQPTARTYFIVAHIFSLHVIMGIKTEIYIYQQLTNLYNFYYGHSPWSDLTLFYK